MDRSIDNWSELNAQTVRQSMFIANHELGIQMPSDNQQESVSLVQNLC